MSTRRSTTSLEIFVFIYLIRTEGEIYFFISPHHLNRSSHMNKKDKFRKFIMCCYPKMHHSQE